MLWLCQSKLCVWSISFWHCYPEWNCWAFSQTMKNQILDYCMLTMLQGTSPQLLKVLTLRFLFCHWQWLMNFRRVVNFWGGNELHIRGTQGNSWLAHIFWLWFHYCIQRSIKSIITGTHAQNRWIWQLFCWFKHQLGNTDNALPVIWKVCLCNVWAKRPCTCWYCQIQFVSTDVSLISSCHQTRTTWKTILSMPIIRWLSIVGVFWSMSMHHPQLAMDGNWKTTALFLSGCVMTLLSRVC